METRKLHVGIRLRYVVVLHDLMGAHINFKLAGEPYSNTFEIITLFDVKLI